MGEGGGEGWWERVGKWGRVDKWGRVVGREGG